jgi:thioredoxin reductase (NADPH)
MIEYKMDVVIIGAGPAGCGAAIYLAQGGCKNIVLLTGYQPGGQLTTTYHVINYLGFSQINGMDLAENMINHCKNNISEENIINDSVLEIKYISDYNYEVKTSTHNYKCKFIVFATGSKHKTLGHEHKYENKGVSYCAICDGNLYRNKIVAVVGGGNSAFESARYLSNIAKKVYLIHRSSNFRAFDVLQKSIKKIEESGKLEILTDSTIEEFKTDNEGYINGIKLKNSLNNETNLIELDGVFINIGFSPNTHILPKEALLDKDQYVLVNGDNETNLKGLFACGDCIAYTIPLRQYKQAIVAASDGCKVALNILEKLFE